MRTEFDFFPRRTQKYRVTVAKINTSKFQFDLETVDEEPPRGTFIAVANSLLLLIIITIIVVVIIIIIIVFIVSVSVIIIIIIVIIIIIIIIIIIYAILGTLC